MRRGDVRDLMIALDHVPDRERVAAWMRERNIPLRDDKIRRYFFLPDDKARRYEQGSYLVQEWQAAGHPGLAVHYGTEEPGTEWGEALGHIQVPWLGLATGIWEEAISMAIQFAKDFEGRVISLQEERQLYPTEEIKEEGSEKEVDP